MHNNEFKTIGLIGKYNDTDAGWMLENLRDYLLARGLDVLLDEGTATNIPDLGLKTIDREGLGNQSDLVIVVGGDGTLLNAARSMAHSEPPLLGINLGRLGFLTDISPDKLNIHLDQVFDGVYQEEARFLLHARIMRDGETVSEAHAFNDVVIHKWDIARMIELDTYINDKYVNTLRADGLIVSTPTGSTAYALSGGGPILQSNLNATVLVPICPHSMSHRPVVIDADSSIEVILTADTQAQVTCDGQINFGLSSGDRIIISKHANPVRLLHPIDYDYFGVLRAKLHWGHKL